MQLQTNQEAFEHLRDVLADLSKSPELQAKYNVEKRLRDVLNAMLCEPVFLPVQVEMPQNVSNVPIPGNTDTVDSTTIITGAISDGEDKQVSFKVKRSSADTFDDVGEEGQLSLDAIAGRSYESGGVNEPQDFAPFPLLKNEGLQVTVFNPETVNNIDVVSIVFNGYSIVARAEAEKRFARIAEKVKQQIGRNYTALPRFVVVKPPAFEDGYAEAETPISGEYRLVYGFRTNIKNAKVNLSKYKTAKYAKDYFPLFALAAENGNSTTNYRWLKSPILLEPEETLKFGFLDTVNGTTRSEGGQVEIYETTV